MSHIVKSPKRIARRRTSTTNAPFSPGAHKRRPDKPRLRGSTPEPDPGGRGGPNGSRIASKTLPVGIVLVAFGAIVTVLAALRYGQVNRQIEAGLVKTDRGMVWIVTLLIVVLSVAALIYMLMGG